MPRRPMVIDIPEQGGITSLLSGVTQGLTTGLMQQDENTRRERLRQQIYRDMLTRDSTNFQRSRDAAAQDYQRNRSDHLANVASGRSWQEQQSQTAEARKQAEEQAKKAEDLQQGQEYLRASGMGQPGEDYYLNPNSQPVVPSLGTRAAESLVTQKRMGEQAAAAQTERAIDNARQDKALGIAQQRADNAATQRGGQLSPDQRLSVAQDSMLMNPGATARPRASISSVPRAAESLPIAAILSPTIPTSASRPGPPRPSNTVPPRRIVS